MKRTDAGRGAAGSGGSGGCEDPNKKPIEKIGHDEEILRKVGAAVNEVLRNATDCDVAKPLFTEAYQRIEDARRVVVVPASHPTLEALKVAGGPRRPGLPLGGRPEVPRASLACPRRRAPRCC